MRCRPRSGRYHNYIKDNAAAAATTLTIRHSRFATLTLAKLVASLALHPPVSATEADYAPHHRLRRSLSSRRSLLVSASANYRHPPCLIITPNHCPVAADSAAGRRAGEARPKGESRKRTEESLLSSGRFRLSPATGGRQCRLPVLSAWLLRRTQLSLVLSWAPRKYRFPRSPRPPPSSPYRRFLRLYLAICFIFSCLAASCAARSDSAVSA